MHNVRIREHIVERVMARRGKFHWFEELESCKTALLIIDMQNTFCAPDSPAEVAGSREIVSAINLFTSDLRKKKIPVFWVLHANNQIDGVSDWELFFNYVVSDDVRQRTIESLAPGQQTIWKDLEHTDCDITVLKNRYSALIPGSSSLETNLESLGIDTLLIAGTKTNICCESTARDAMMLGYKVVMVEDCCAALSDDEHLGALESIIQQFGDVRTSSEVIEILK